MLRGSKLKGALTVREHAPAHSRFTPELVRECVYTRVEKACHPIIHGIGSDAEEFVTLCAGQAAEPLSLSALHPIPFVPLPLRHQSSVPCSEQTVARS